jgi:hypothetical protein
MCEADRADCLDSCGLLCAVISAITQVPHRNQISITQDLTEPDDAAIRLRYESTNQTRHLSVQIQIRLKSDVRWYVRRLPYFTLVPQKLVYQPAVPHKYMAETFRLALIF